MANIKSEPQGGKLKDECIIWAVSVEVCVCLDGLQWIYEYSFVYKGLFSGFLVYWKSSCPDTMIEIKQNKNYNNTINAAVEIIYNNIFFLN